MNRRVLYRFHIERSQLVRSLRSHCNKIGGIWVQCEFDDVPHVPKWGDRVTGCGIELRVFDVQYYAKRSKTYGDHHSALVECSMTEPMDRKARIMGDNLMLPRKDLVSKQDLRRCVSSGWELTGIEPNCFS